MDLDLAPKIGFDGHPPELREPRDLEGRGLRNIEHQVWRFDTLDRLLARKTIEPHHHDAGRKLQRDWETASTIPCSSGTSQAGGQQRGSITPADAKLMASARFRDALRALGPANREMMLCIVIRNESVVFAAEQRKIDHRAFTGAFVAAIDQLAHHYGLVLTNGRNRANDPP